jgi:hypothetical protein
MSTLLCASGPPRFGPVAMVFLSAISEIIQSCCKL